MIQLHKALCLVGIFDKQTWRNPAPNENQETGMETKIRLAFNSALTALPENGVFDSRAFVDEVAPIRGKLMRLDGIADVFMARYAVEVTYMSNVTDADQVLVHARETFDWASDNGFFPLRGKKSVEVTIDAS